MKNKKKLIIISIVSLILIGLASFYGINQDQFKASLFINQPFDNGFYETENNFGMVDLQEFNYSVSLISPINGEMVSNGDQNNPYEWFFDWNDVPNTSSYELIVQRANDNRPFIRTFVNQSEYRSPSNWPIDESELDNWQWKVRAQTNSGWTDWSDIGQFSVASNQTQTQSSALSANPNIKVEIPNLTDVTNNSSKPRLRGVPYTRLGISGTIAPIPTASYQVEAKLNNINGISLPSKSKFIVGMYQVSCNTACLEDSLNDYKVRLMENKSVDQSTSNTNFSTEVDMYMDGEAKYLIFAAIGQETDYPISSNNGYFSPGFKELEDQDRSDNYAFKLVTMDDGVIVQQKDLSLKEALNQKGNIKLNIFDNNTTGALWTILQSIQ